jgi:hypothetical protein
VEAVVKFERGRPDRRTAKTKSNFKMMHCQLPKFSRRIPDYGQSIISNVRGMPSGYRQHMSNFNFF